MSQALRAHSPEQQEWAYVGQRLAARGRMRVSRDGGRNYPARDERNITSELPNQPTAVMVYNTSGQAPTLVFDLDSSRGNVEADTAILTRLLERHQCRWFSDHSPNGGRHIYVPLAAPMPFHTASTLVRALSAQLPTLDPLPMLNIQGGCIRPPGARHKSGGHQQLDQPINLAVDTLHSRTPAAHADSFVAEVMRLWTPPVPAATQRDDTVQAHAADDAPLRPLPGHREPDGDYARIARTGEWPAHRYASPSEARQAVIWAAVASGLSLTDVARRVQDGTWPGLASLYARYAPGQRHKALVRDWRNAKRFEIRRRDQSTSPHVQKDTTSPINTQRGVASQVQRGVREWLAAVDIVTRHEKPSVRAVLYALAQAALQAGSLDLEFGNRSLSLGCGLDQATVGKVLNSIMGWGSDRSLIDKVKPASGVSAATYSLVIPKLLRAACEAKPWRKGRVHGVRPAFWELGLTAAFAYQALERAGRAVSARELAVDACISVSSAHEALITLSSWGLATRNAEGWALGPASVEALAERLGCDDIFEAKKARYRSERRAWWIHLGLIHRLVVDDAPPPPPGDLAPVVDIATRAKRPRDGLPEDRFLAPALTLVTEMLGAVVIETLPRS